ncbi:uncharacterized protein LOC117171423 [Belonocnema kinseyi]|uniref:uncharacterized protein LOC117171423 n=1 Tax=Belonocnema kinseyi TaxID=2817044 RepID=UPI00143DF5E4|nr:uncharacterized protein LOC117171423 [Belonocnema kinseyi]
MKIFILLFTSMVFLNFTGAMMRGRYLEARKPARNPPADPTAIRMLIPKDRPILLQMPGDHVVMSILREEKRGLPSWLNPRSPGFEMPERIFINEPGEPRIYGLKADFGQTLHNKNDPLVQGYTCFIRKSTGILAARLQPISRPDIIMETHKMPYVFLRTEPDNLIYGGPIATLSIDNIPNWINNYDL